MEELLRPPAEETKRRWKALEKALADRLEGWLTTGSGNKSDKGDAKSYRFLGECKYRWACDSGGFYLPLDLQWLETIWRHAQRVDKVPLLALEWGDGTRAFAVPTSYLNVDLEWPHAGTNPLVTSGRIIRLSPGDTEMSTVDYSFLNIEVPERYWTFMNWTDLSWLRREELKEREEIGKKAVSKLSGGATRWQKKSFPLKPKGAWRK